MKLILATLLLTITLFASHIDDFADTNNFERDYSTALEKAKNENKLLVVVVSNNRCGWCKKFEKETLTNNSVNFILDNKTVTLIVDIHENGYSGMKEFQTESTPKTFFVNSSSAEVLFDISGYLPSYDFKSDLELAIEFQEDDL